MRRFGLFYLEFSLQGLKYIVPLHYFSRKKGLKGGLASQCKVCNGGTYRTKGDRRTLVLRFGVLNRQRMAIEHYEQLQASQNGRCAICHRLPGKRRLDVDHNHDTGQIRGLLCRSCNTALGKFQDSIEILANASAYLQAYDLLSFDRWKECWAPGDNGEDYDLKAAFEAGVTPDVSGHWPDLFKRPNHPTFSVESIYAVGSDATKAGHWEGNQFIRAKGAQNSGTVLNSARN